MAPKYRKVDPRVWHDEGFRSLSKEERLIALYCLTSSQTNRIGIFYLSPALASEEIGIPQNRYAVGIRNVCHTLGWSLDNATNVLFLPTWWKYNGRCGPMQMKGMIHDLHNLPQTRLIKEFLSNKRYLSEAEFKVLDTYAIRMDGVCAICAQEQEQEQEQEQKIFSSGQAPTEEKPKYRYEDEDLTGANWMWGLIRNMQPNRKQPNIQSWANDIRLMREVDKRSYREIQEVFLWANKDDFWKTNILSPSKLRSKFDDLVLKKAQGVKAKQPAPEPRCPGPWMDELQPREPMRA